MKKFFVLSGDQGLIIYLSCVASLLCSLAAPTIHKVMASSLPTRLIALEDTIFSVSVMISCMAWKVESFKRLLSRLFLPLAITECILAIGSAVWMAIDFNVIPYYISYIVIGSLFSVYISRIVTGFRAKMFNGEKREEFDNNRNLFGALPGIFGSVLATIQPASIEVAVILWGLGSLGITGWIIVYLRHRDKLK